MKIALVNTASPFVRGGAEILVDDLQEQLIRRGHQVRLFRLPFPDDYEVGLTELVLASKLLDFSSYDKVIAFKFPAYCVCHRHKTLWMFHQFRQVYDLYGEKDGLPDTKQAAALKHIITKLDTTEIGNVEKVFVNAEEVKNRLLTYNGIMSEVLTPPLLNVENYVSGKTGDYFYYPSRVTPLKRQDLVVQAMRYVKTPVRLVIAGKCTEPEYEQKIRSLIKEYELEKKVSYKNVWVEDEEKIRMLSNSLGVLYTPYLEDSCGFVTFEGFYSSKPVISCVDSGGTKEFITDSVTGYLTEAIPQALAEKMDYLYENRELAAQMGKCAREELLKKKITWDETVRRLLI